MLAAADVPARVSDANVPGDGFMDCKREDDDDDDDLSPAPGYVEPPSKWETKPVSKKVQRIFDALEITKVHPEVRASARTRGRNR
jgi:hypothetical protein